MITGTPWPYEEKRKYFVYGFWHIHEGKPYVKDGDKIEIHKFDDINAATEYMKEQALTNVNITWCLTWDKYEIEKIIDND